MNMRVALIIGSTLAAMIVSGVLAWLMRAFDSEPALQGAVWIVHFWITLPAMIAVALSAVWHTRGTRTADCPDTTLSARIAWWSFPVFGMLLALMQFIEAVVLADATEGYVGSIMMNMAARPLFSSPTR